MCGCKCCIYAKSIHLLLLSWHDPYFKKPDIKVSMLKTEVLVKKKICIYETYKNRLIPHVRHIYAKESDIAQDTICAYPQSDHALPHW